MQWLIESECEHIPQLYCVQILYDFRCASSQFHAFSTSLGQQGATALVGAAIKGHTSVVAKILACPRVDVNKMGKVCYLLSASVSEVVMSNL